VRPDPRTLLEEVLSGKELTDREIEVLQLSADGLTMPQIGEALHLSPETIKAYRKRTIAKLEALNGTHAAIIALRRGLIR
jgi:two-component system, NarL family, response regulator